MSEPAGTDAEPLRARTVRGVGWNLVGVGVQVVLQTAVLMLLARLVTPEEFGLVAAALIVVSIASLVAAVGLGPSLVQLEDLTDVHVRVAFTTFVLLGVSLWGLVTWQAGTIAQLFEIPDLRPVVPLLGAVLVLQNLTVGDWLLQRRLDFRTLAILELWSYAIGFGLVAVPLALLGAGLHAIVAGHVVQSASRTVLLWMRAPHPARPTLRWPELRDLLTFGGGHMLGRFIGRVAVQGDNLVVARWLGPVALGLYGRAYQLMVMPSELIGGVANRVLFPSMAAVQRDRSRLAQAYLGSSVALATVTLPAAVVAMLVAPELVLVVLGPDWLDLVPAFRVMALGIVLRTTFKVGDALVQATGHVYRRAARLAIYAAAVVGGAMVGQQWGIAGVATAILGALTLHAVLMTQLGLRLTGLRWGQFLGAHVPALLTGLATLAVVAPAASGLRSAGAAPLVVLGGAGCGLLLTGLVVLRAAPTVPAMRLATRLVQDVLDASSGSTGAVLGRLAGPRYVRSAITTTERDQPPPPTKESRHEPADSNHRDDHALGPPRPNPTR